MDEPIASKLRTCKEKKSNSLLREKVVPLTRTSQWYNIRPPTPTTYSGQPCSNLAFSVGSISFHILYMHWTTPFFGRCFKRTIWWRNRSQGGLGGLQLNEGHMWGPKVFSEMTSSAINPIYKNAVESSTRCRNCVSDPLMFQEIHRHSLHLAQYHDHADCRLIIWVLALSPPFFIFCCSFVFPVFCYLLWKWEWSYI